MKNQRYKYYLLKTKNLYQQPVVRISTTLILTLVIISFFGFFAIKPTLVTIIKLNKELKEKQEVNKVLGRKIDILSKAQASYAQVIDDLNLVERALPQKAGFNQFASRINFLAFSNNLVLLSVSFGQFDLVAPSPQPGVNTLSLSLSVAGSFTDIKNFLQELENIDRVVQIDSVSFSIKSKTTPVKMQADLKTKVFWLPRGSNKN